MTARVPRPSPAAATQVAPWLGAVLLWALALAASAEAPDGAFGLVFGEPVAAELLRQPSPIVVAREPLGTALSRLHRDRPATMEQAWRDFVPPTIPAALRERQSHFQVLVDEQSRPLRIRVSTSALKGQCPTWMAEVDAVLSRRYADLSVLAATRPGFTPSSVYGSPANTAELTCSTDGDLGLIEYTNVVALQAWQLRERPRIEGWYGSLLGEAMSLGPLGVRAVFGFQWGEPSPLARGVPDLMLDVEPPEPFARFPNARYSAVFAPDGTPVMLRVRSCPDNAAMRAQMELFGDALRTYPGVTVKDSAQHIVLRVADDLLSLRLEGDRCLNFAITDGDAQRAMIARRKEAKLLRQEREQRRMAAAQRGL